MTHTHITLLDVPQDEAAEWLAENAITAALSPMQNDITVIFDNVLVDHADDDEPLEALLHVASEISYELGCPAWLVILSDEALIYSLYRDGDLIDSYGVNTQTAPEGGDAELLAALFEQPKKAIKTIRATLKRDMQANQETPAARYRALLDALAVPPLAVGTDYAALKAGTPPPHFDLDAVVFVEPDSDDDSTPAESSEAED